MSTEGTFVHGRRGLANPSGNSTGRTIALRRPSHDSAAMEPGRARLLTLHLAALVCAMLGWLLTWLGGQCLGAAARVARNLPPR